MRLWDTDILLLFVLMLFVAVSTIALNRLNEIEKTLARVERHVQDALQVFESSKNANE